MDNEGYEKGDGDLVNGYDNSANEFEISDSPEGTQKKSLLQKFREYPKCVFFIFSNEFCERFSYYGAQAVLTLYLKNQLGYNDTNATALYNGFNALCYFTCIFGCILADGFIGKFHTILWVSLFYACGNIVLALAASLKGSNIHPALDLVGLLIIALGTGGIKPCVSAFGADQFKKGQEKWLETFFSVFYFSINAGGCISTFITPIFRTRHCNGEDSCYPLAFGVPAALMVAACAFFVLGSFWYIRLPPKDNVILRAFKVFFYSIQNKIRFSIKRERFLDHYLDDHSCEYDHRCKELGRCYQAQFVKDLVAVGKLLVVYLPMPIFWALYNQQGSKWILQGTEMTGKVGSTHILPDQVPTINPILIMVFILLFSGVIYPVVGKCINLTPLRKMSAGGLLAGLAYVVTGLVQLKIQPTLPVIPNKGHIRLSFMNHGECDVSVHLYTNWNTTKPVADDFTIGVNQNFNKTYNILDGSSVKWDISSKVPGCNYSEASGEMAIKNRGAYYFPIAEGHTVGYEEPLTKPSKGEGEGVYTFNFFVPGYNTTDSSLILCKPDGGYDYTAAKHGCVNNTDNEMYITIPVQSFNDSALQETIKPGTWLVWLPSEKGQLEPTNSPPNFNFSFDDEGAINTITIVGETTDDINVYEDQLTGPNTVSILWQIPQYVILTAAEILFSITGLEFSYSQAPQSMKSILQAVYMLTTAIGNVIIIFIVLLEIFENQAYVFFLFAGLMFAVMLIFMLIAQFHYEYVSHVGEGAEEEEKMKKKESNT